MPLSRIALLVSVALSTPGCKKSTDANSPFRLGFFPNITHAQALVGTTDGTFERALSGKKLEVKKFNAGPSAMEALLAGEIDATYVGPSPAINAYLKSKGALRVIAGACAGGAEFIVRGVKGAAALKGKRVASPQLGNTQDIALRHWLKSQGLNTDAAGGDVKITALANPDILNVFRQGEIEGAWVPEPWGARLIAEAGGTILVDERTLWEGGRFPTTLLVASRKALTERREDLKAILKAHLELTQRARENPAFGALANDAFGQITTRKLPDAVLVDALSRVEFLSDPMEKQLVLNAQHAAQLGFLGSPDVSGLVDASLLAELEGASARP